MVGDAVAGRQKGVKDLTLVATGVAAMRAGSALFARHFRAEHRYYGPTNSIGSLPPAALLDALAWVSG